MNRSVLAFAFLAVLVALAPSVHAQATGSDCSTAMSAAELARKISVPSNRVTQILSGTRRITGDTALRLGHFFGTSAQFWLNLQTLYDVRIAEQKRGKAIRSLSRLKRKELVHA